MHMTNNRVVKYNFIQLRTSTRKKNATFGTKMLKKEILKYDSKFTPTYSKNFKEEKIVAIWAPTFFYVS